MPGIEMVKCRVKIDHETERAWLINRSMNPHHRSDWIPKRLVQLEHMPDGSIFALMSRRLAEDYRLIDEYTEEVTA